MDDLVEIGELENYVRGTSCMILFLSRGYFRSKNCLKEIFATVEQMKPWVLVHEADPGKGGLTLQASKDECPSELHDIIFTHSEYMALDGKLNITCSAGPRQVVTWMRIKDFQLLSLRLICRQVLRHTPFYKNIARDHERFLDGGPSDRRSSRRSSRGLKTSNVVEELEGVYVPGEVVSLNLSCDHLPQAARLIYSRFNPGSYTFGKEMVRAITGITLIAEAASSLSENQEQEGVFEVGDRVVHVKHGLGVVTGMWLDGRMGIAFDDGQSHNYKPSSVSKKISRAPPSSPDPPLSFNSRAGSAFSSIGHEPEQMKKNTSHVGTSALNASQPQSSPQARARVGIRRASAYRHPTKALLSRQSSLDGTGGLGSVERLLLYLNRDTWTGDDGPKLAQTVRRAWCAACRRTGP